MHRVQFFQDDGYLVDSVGSFIGSVLGSGESAVVVATRAHRVAFAHRIRRCGVDLEAVSASGRYIERDANGLLTEFLLEDRIDVGLFEERITAIILSAQAASESRNPCVSIFAEMVTRLVETHSVQTALELEQCWNELARKKSFLLHCAYPLSLFPNESDGASILHFCEAHDDVVPAEEFSGLQGNDARMKQVVLLQQKASVLAHEIAERNRLLAAEQEAREVAENALRLRDDFLSIASHELRTPLTVLKASVELLMRQREKGLMSEDQLDRTLLVVLQGAKRMGRLTDELLDVSRIRMGKVGLDGDNVDLRDAVGKAVEAVEAQFGTDCSFELDLPPVSSVVRGDAGRLEEVVINLLQNAAKFSPQGGRTHIRLTDEEDGFLLMVSDEGIGLPNGAEEAIFEPFGRGSNAIAHQYQGMGLGLYICRNSVEAHGGRIWARNCPAARGTQLFVWLPAAEAAGSEFTPDESVA